MKTAIQDLPAEVQAKLIRERMGFQYRLLFVLLSAVVGLNVLPLAVSLFRRPSDAIVSNINQNTLLMTGSVCNGVGILMGMGLSSREVTKHKDDDEDDKKPEDKPTGK